MTESLTLQIADYINERKLAKLEPNQKKLDRALAKGSEAERLEAKQQFNEANAKWSEVFEPATWLTDAARRAKQISLSTHSAKFIHSDAKSSSCLHVLNESGAKYVATRSLKQKTLDASGNAAALDVARLLKVQADGRCLVDELQAGHVQSLEPFSSDQALHQEWMQGFSQALGDSRITSHSLAKQVYFPVGDNEYHLLLPLYASSLAHQLHDKVTTTRFSDEAKARREAKRKEQYMEGIDVSFPNTVIQAFGGSKPQNISQLNSERYGNNFLLPCSPPTWQSQTKPLFHTVSLFKQGLPRTVYRLLRDFRGFLENLRPDQKNLAIRERRDNDYLQPIIDAVLERAAHYQAMAENAGWSAKEECVLKQHYKYWLDTWNTDSIFIQQREKNDWQSLVAADFSLWLNASLNQSKSYVFADDESLYWKKVFAKQLKEFEWATPKAEVKV